MNSCANCKHHHINCYGDDECRRGMEGIKAMPYNDHILVEYPLIGIIHEIWNCKWWTQKFEIRSKSCLKNLKQQSR